MKYLVTGIAGFIAARTAQFLLDRGHQVVGIDNLNDYYDKRLKYFRLHSLAKSQSAGSEILSLFEDAFRHGELPEASASDFATGNLSFVELDIENSDRVSDLFQQHSFDAVLNLAARAGVRYSMVNPHVYVSTNATGTINLMEAMRVSGVGKLVLASTSSLYAGQEMPFSESLAVNNPISPYAASKKAAEMLAHSYHHLYDLDVSIVRYFTVFGPVGRPDMSIFRFIKWIDEEKPIELFGDGSQSRDFTFVDDIANGTIAALRPVGYEIFNLGGGRNPITLNQIIKWIEDTLGKKAVRTNKQFHKADIKETWADIELAKRRLDWTPSIGVLEGIRETIKWYSENRPWLEKVSL